MIFLFLLIPFLSLNASIVDILDYSAFPPFDGKPRIYIIGDSISQGYAHQLDRKLNHYQVIHSPGNALDSVYGATHIESWASLSNEWEACILNHGVHDITEVKKIPPFRYVRNISYEMEALKKNCKRRMFVTTTMIPKNTIGIKNSDAILYNSHVLNLLKKVDDIKICDLYQKSLEIPFFYKNALEENNVHFTVWGDERLAEYILDCLKREFADLFE